jgi:hypothetical protein
MNFNTSSLLDKLINEHPNAWIKVGEEFIPTRKELWTCELFQRLFEHNQFKLHLELPIILTLGEEYSEIVKLFHHKLIYKNKIEYIKLSEENQLLFLLFLDSIMTSKELSGFLFLDRKNYERNFKLFSVKIWIRLLEFTFNVEFLDGDERIRLCYAIYQGSYDDSSKTNDYRKRLANTNKGIILRDHPEFARALEYYKVDYYRVLRYHEPYPDYRKGGMGPN